MRLSLCDSVYATQSEFGFDGFMDFLDWYKFLFKDKSDFVIYLRT